MIHSRKKFTSAHGNLFVLFSERFNWKNNWAYRSQVQRLFISDGAALFQVGCYNVVSMVHWLLVSCRFWLRYGLWKSRRKSNIFATSALSLVPHQYVYSNHLLFILFFHAKDKKPHKEQIFIKDCTLQILNTSLKGLVDKLLSVRLLLQLCYYDRVPSPQRKLDVSKSWQGSATKGA